MDVDVDVELDVDVDRDPDLAVVHDHVHDRVHDQVQVHVHVLARALRHAVTMTSLKTVGFGKTAEDLACAELERRGYAVLARRYRTRGGEIDIIARDGQTVVFVEVKARTDDRCGHPAEAVTAWKRRRIAAMAWDFLARRRLLHAPCRFDVVAVLGPDGGPQRIDVIRAAFWIDN